MTTPSSQIGPYKLERELGRGGMGVVHLARDARLDRFVAIKALPEAFASNEERLARFEREARTLAQLHHPNIAGIYGVEEQDGRRYLALEYVEGETLAERLDRGPIPVEEALEIAAQIAAGVQAAHDAGVIHRDLKPDNIKLTPAGEVKILDFGLARAEGSSSSGVALSESPTLTSATPRSPTMPGAIMGTAAYMSPEQARGRPIDKRSDIWSFGVVLFEMLTGANPFAGETASDSIGATLHKDIDLGRLPAGVGPAVRRTLERCLARDREARWRDIGDVRLELLAAMRGADEPASPAAARRRPTLAVLTAAATTALAVGAAAWLLRPAAPAPLVADLTLQFSAEKTLASWSFPKISADGKRTIAKAGEGSGSVVLVRDIDESAARIVPSTEGATELGLSPDGRWVVFLQDGSMRKAPIDGGPAITICEPESVRGVAWTSDDWIIFGQRVGPLLRVSAAGGQPEPLFSVEGEGDDYSDRHPALLPDGRGVLFVRVQGDFAMWDGSSALWAARLDGGEAHLVARGASHGRYIPGGRIAMQREDSLMVAAFDLERLALTGQESPALRGVRSASPSAPPQFDISLSGTLIYELETDSTLVQRRLELVSLEGVARPFIAREGAFEWAVFSDDGRFLALEIETEAGNSLATLDLERDLLRAIPGDRTRNSRLPVWSPDGRRLLFVRPEGGDPRLLRHLVAGVDEPALVEADDSWLLPLDWSSDGQRVLVTKLDADGGADLGFLRFDAGGELLSGALEPFIEWAGVQSFGSFSPDDRWVLAATSSRRQGRSLFVVSADDPSRMTQVSDQNATFGLWSPDGGTIYFCDRSAEPATIYAVDCSVSEQGEFIVSKPRRLFDLEGVDVSLHDIATDGAAFLVSRPVAPAGRPAEKNSVQIVLNWAERVDRSMRGR